MNIRRSENILIKKVSITNMTYDGIYHGYNSKSVTIDGVSCVQNTRQAISVTSATDLTIKNSEFNDTNVLKLIDSNGNIRDSCGNRLVFEVNESEPILDNISIENSEFLKNQVGLSFSVSKATADAKDISIKVNDCISKDNETLQIRVSEWALSEDDAIGGDITFDQVVADGINPISINMGKLQLAFSNMIAKISDEEVRQKNENPLVKVVQILDGEDASFTFNGDIYSDELEGKCNRVFAYTKKNNINIKNTFFDDKIRIIKSDNTFVYIDIPAIVNNPNSRISQVRK